MTYKTQIQKWLESSIVDEVTKAEIEKLDETEAEDSFYCSLKFGTGGLRGVMGVGTNRMNVYTVRQATQGLASEILGIGGDAPSRGVAIAYDSRNNSPEFAAECAKVLTANGIKTYLFESLRPTPELSFTVRHLGCIRGIVITASHNPKQYNGYKVYGEDGGQIAPESAKIIQGFIDNTDIFEGVRITDDANPIMLGADVDAEYIKCVKACAFNTQIPEDFKVVYTPLHGSGNLLVRRILDEIGVKNVFTVPEQEMPDGNFSTVRSPNPEDAEALKIAIDYAKEQGADLVLGTDPDSDRVGIAVPDGNGGYKPLTGNQTGALLCEYMLQNTKLNENSTVVKTIVTTEMIASICKSYGVKLIDVLTGFKYIGEQIKILEDKGQKDDFVFGLEESYGYLAGTYARDKDAVVASMLIAGMAASCKYEGITILDKLNALYEKYGYYMEKMETATLTGIAGLEEIKSIMAKFRKGPLPLDIEKTEDYSLGINSLPKSDVLKFFTSDGSHFEVRPSGTEPKIKFYFGVCSDSYEESVRKLQNLKDKVMGFAFDK